MVNINFNDCLKSSKVLLFFLSTELTLGAKLFRTGIVFFTLPLSLLILSSFKGTLFLSDKGHVGMLNDSLFLFAVFLVPLLLFVLQTILKKFIYFLQELPKLSNYSNTEKINRIINKYRLYINKKRPIIIVFKLIFLLFYLYSNIKALYYREGGWNSSEHILEFSLTVFFVIILFIAIFEILTLFLLIVTAQIKLTTELTNNYLIQIEPLSLDKSGSLKSLGELSLSFTYILIPFVISATTHYLTWGTLTAGYLFSLILLFISTVFLFFFPLGTVHTLMMNSKKEFLKKIDEIYIHLTTNILDNIEENSENIEQLKERSEIIKEIYEIGNKLPVWPFDLKILTKFTAVLFGPIFLIILEYVIQILISKMI